MAALHETNYAGPLHYEIDPDPAGPEKCLMDIKQNFSRLMNLAPKKTRKQKAENNIMYVSLFFDVEDCVTPISDDIAKDLADIVSDHGLKGNFMVVGDKARTLMERDRMDVIESLCRHEIGLHTNRHSRHPNIAEFLEDKRWSDGIEETVFREGPGVKTIEQIFGKSPACWGQSGGSWAPQVHPAMKRLGIPIIVYPETHTQSSDVHWYGGILTFSYRHFLEDFDQNYSDDTKFEKKFQDFKTKVSEYLEAGFPWTGVFCAHPITVRAYEFGDALNFARGNETPLESWEQPRLKSEAEYQTALKNFAVLVKYIATHPRLRVLPVGALKKKFGRVADKIGHENLLGYAKKVCRVKDIPTDDSRLSPAEAVDVLVKAILALSRGANQREYYIRHVDGPVNIPPEIRSTIRVAWDVFRSGCESVKLFIDRNGHLPASIDMNGASVGIGSFYHTACESFGNLAAKKTPKRVTFRPGLQIPSIAKLIAKRTEAGYRGWVIHKPDLNVTNLLELTRLQTWTLKPAAF